MIHPVMSSGISLHVERFFFVMSSDFFFVMSSEVETSINRIIKEI